MSPVDGVKCQGEIANEIISLAYTRKKKNSKRGETARDRSRARARQLKLLSKSAGPEAFSGRAIYPGLVTSEWSKQISSGARRGWHTQRVRCTVITGDLPDGTHRMHINHRSLRSCNTRTTDTLRIGISLFPAIST